MSPLMDRIAIITLVVCAFGLLFLNGFKYSDKIEKCIDNGNSFSYCNDNAIFQGD